MALEKKEVKQRMKTAKTVMREKKKEITDGLNAILKAGENDPALMSNLRGCMSTFAKAAAEHKRMADKL